MEPDRDQDTEKDSAPPTTARTPTSAARRGASADPQPSSGRRYVIHTPGQLARGIRASSVPHRTPTAQTGQPGLGAGSGPGSGPVPSSGGRRLGESVGLSASARRLNPTSMNTATPHARKAIEILKGRRTAIFDTPGRNGRPSRRRLSLGADQQKDAPFDALRNLSRRLAPVTQRVVTSSSPGSAAASRVSLARDPTGRDFLRGPLDSGGAGDDDDDGDDDSGFLKKRPRLSLPLDADDGDGDLRRPRTSGLEDENYTVLSIEEGRRALSEQPWSRHDRDSLRMSDIFRVGQADFTGEVDFDGTVPVPPFDLGDDGQLGGGNDDVTFERLDLSPRRAEALVGRQSDFGTIEVPVDVDSPFRFDPELQDNSLDVPELGFDDHSQEATSPLGLPIPGREPDATVDEDDQDDQDHAEAGGDFDDEMPDQTGELFDNDVPGGFDDADEELDDHERDDDAEETALADAAEEQTAGNTGTKRKKRSATAAKFGVHDPCLPSTVVKRLAQTLAVNSGAGGKISQETLQAMMLATDWFFEQIGDDLRAYAGHAGRKTIDESDVAMLMMRQRQTSSRATIFSLAQRHLPRELLQELRMPPVASPPKKRRKVGEEQQETGE